MAAKKSLVQNSGLSVSALSFTASCSWLPIQSCHPLYILLAHVLLYPVGIILQLPGSCGQLDTAIQTIDKLCCLSNYLKADEIKSNFNTVEALHLSTFGKDVYTTFEFHDIN